MLRLLWVSLQDRAHPKEAFMKHKKTRVYHFLRGDKALDDLRRRHIKLSEIDKLNDPFELWCVAQTDPAVRTALRKYKTQMTRQFGMLCFCPHWQNPVLWSHYADKHAGICLGFDVPQDTLKPVRYTAVRPPLQAPPTKDSADRLLYTKYKDWKYEQELRGWFTLEKRDPVSGLYFYDFDDRVKLREVIAGPLCKVPEVTIRAALKGYPAKVRVIKARLAFKTFRVVQDLRGFRKC